MKTNTMKKLHLLFLLFFIPITFHAQKTLTGLWTGKLTNDSTTVRQDQSFEIALTEYRGKVYGYSRSTFIVNDTLYYIMKRVKGTIEGDVCEIKDDDIISYNFRGKIDKGVKVTTTFRMNKQDSAWYLAGDWKTNQTKKFYSISGKVDLKEEPDMEKSKIFPHLEELNLAKEVPFYAETKKPQTPAVTPVEKTSVAVNKPSAKNNKQPEDMPAKKADYVKNKTEEKKQQEVTKDIAKNDKNEIKKTEPPVVINNKPVEEKKVTTEVVTKPQVNNEQPVAKNEEKNKPAETTVAVNKPVVEEKKNITAPITSSTIAETKKTVPSVMETKPDIKLPVAAAMVKERKTAPPQEVLFKSDSLELSLYDNGEVDGDTVSVIMNGELILAKQGLKTSAIKKTIYIKPGDNEIMLVLYAENLGKYPPNTGLLVVYDGDDRYQVRFSADLQQNASVIFRRKQK